ncbi:nitroreductase [Marinobacter guineae]|uniref:Putative NAD(P)H nitroreductase n=1 Tax=Marinobacter guineae TaxID=432303 RepID=A0A2G1VBE1_9GAMM|nr:nitroreductase family protein [Marinobacter guineae]PHQ24066.1 nitroreductase [Marinobacter guineae]
MTAVTDFLLNRSSEPRLEAPAPDRETLNRAFACAARAPDHALLRPWRYLVVEGEGLEALGELFASTCANNSDEREIEKLRRAPLRAPMIIIGIASPSPHPKVPEVEQVMSTAAGMSFLELALQDAGYGVMWRTGAVAYHSAVHEGLGLDEHEQIVGFLYTGSVSTVKPAVPRPGVDEFVRNWP